MKGSAPSVAIQPDKAGYTEGDMVTVTSTVTDKDTGQSIITGVDDSGVDVVQTTMRTDRFVYDWRLEGVQIGSDASVRFPAELTKTHVSLTVTDRQGNTGSDAKTLVIEPKPVGIALGCAMGAMIDGSRSRTQRWQDFENAIGNSPRVLRVYLNEAQTETLIQKWEANHAAQLWPVAGDIWTVGTPHVHDIALSMKPNHVQYAAGRYDGLIQALCAQYPGPGIFRITHWHEPYDNIYKGADFTLAQYKATIARMIQLTAPYENVQPWIVLTGEAFDLNEEGGDKDPDHYLVPGIYGVAGDRYQVPSQRHDGTPWWTPEFMFGRYVAWCRANGVAAGLWEYGCAPDFDNVNRRSQDLIATYNFCVANNIEVLLVFDNWGPKGPWYPDQIIHLTDYYTPNDPDVGTVIPPIVYDQVSADTWHSLFTA